jgi:hypothetical protein
MSKMRESLNLRDSFSFDVVRGSPMIWDGMPLQGYFRGQVWRPSKSGIMRLVHDTAWIKNLVMDAAKSYLFDAAFNAAAQSSNWYLSLIDGTGFTSILASHTMAAHAGWSEFVSYSGGTRPAWTKGATAANSITAAAVSVFNITGGGGTLAGGFLTNNNVLSGATGILWSAGQFPSPVPVSSGDQMRLNYALSA